MAYFFGKELREKLGVPVGLIKSAVGGTVAEAWTPRADLETNPTLKPLLELQVKNVAEYPKVLAAYKDREPQLLAKYEQDLRRPRRPVRKLRANRCPRRTRAPAPIGPPACTTVRIAPLEPYAIRGVIWYQGNRTRTRQRISDALPAP